MVTPGRSHSINPRRDFVYSHGTKLHAYSKADVPYPLSYDNRVFELLRNLLKLSRLRRLRRFAPRGLLDRALIYCTKGSVSFRDFKGDTPKRVLDLGCGVRPHATQTSSHQPLTRVASSEIGSLTLPRHGPTARS